MESAARGEQSCSAVRTELAAASASLKLDRRVLYLYRIQSQIDPPGPVRAGRRGPEDDVPETFDEPFTGTGGEGGVIGMLEVILSDFVMRRRRRWSTTSS